MIETLSAALQRLKQEIAHSVDTPIVLAQDTLEQQFHGLSLSQLAMLTDAPVLAAVGRLRLADGTIVERFVIDGKNEQQREMLARRLVLDQTALAETGAVREILELQGGAPCRALMRDREGIVYRVSNGQPVVDKELTSALQRDRQAVARDEAPAVPLSQRLPVVVSDPLGFYGTVGEVLHGLAAVNAYNQVALQAMVRLTEATGEKDADGALAAASPDVLADAFRGILSAARQIETLVDALNLRMTGLLRLVERTEAPAKSQPPADGTDNRPGNLHPAAPGRQEHLP